MKLEELINTYHAQLSENDKQVLHTITARQQEFSNCTCDYMATACNISRATLLRICRKIGLTSFSDLKLILKKEEHTPTQDTDNMYDTFHTLIDELKKFSYHTICKVLYHCETVYIYGTGNEQKTLAAEFKRIFLTAGKCVVDVFDAGEIDFIKNRFQKKDVFIIISLSGETKEGIHILQSIASTDIQRISITRLQNNTISQLCEHNLYVATKVVESSLSHYEMVSAFYVLMDLLFINYLDYQRRQEYNEN